MLSNNDIVKIKLIAKNAGDIILDYYQSYQEQDTNYKKDGSEVTKADIAANDFINNELIKLFPDIPIVSEENTESENFAAAKSPLYFLIDPLDGTQSFVKKQDEFTVNIALISNSKPIFGLIYLPVGNILYHTDADFNAYKNDKQIFAVAASEKYRVICTKREPEKSEILTYLNDNNINAESFLSVSSSLKFCQIAEGQADLYPRKVSIYAWDVAAGNAIVNASGGSMKDYYGADISYKFTESFKIPQFVVRGAMNDIVSEDKNITPVTSKISYQQRVERSGHQGGVLWFTGLSGSGKSTISALLQEKLFEEGYNIFVLDGDNIRGGISQNLTFDTIGRSENARRVAEIAKLFAENGFIVITALISPFEIDRQKAKDILGDFVKFVHIDASVDVCEQRDVKGLYKKARAGEIKNFTGIGSPYEVPSEADFTVNTNNSSIEDSSNSLIDYIKSEFPKI
ncbi:MAG: adenylyl-sulfate kinase [Rickettsiales bacterium]|nr:adenylyl-sulfate kinase [Rickettsiales bacterium]